MRPAGGGSAPGGRVSVCKDHRKVAHRLPCRATLGHHCPIPSSPLGPNHRCLPVLGGTVMRATSRPRWPGPSVTLLPGRMVAGGEDPQGHAADGKAPCARLGGYVL